MKYYAIARGKNTGIFETSDEFNKYKIGKYSCGKVFSSKELAKKYIKDINKALQYQHYAFVDFEFTCSQKKQEFKDQNHIGEVLSIGIVITNQYGEIIDQFYSTIKPKYNYKLTKFCVKLTNLNQDDINNSKHLVSVLNSASKFITHYGIKKCFCFGTSDYLQTKKDLQNYKNHYLFDHCSKFVEKLYDCQHDVCRRIIDKECDISLLDCKKLLEIEGNIKHNALSDAKDLATIYFKSIYYQPSKKIIHKYVETRENKIKYKQFKHFVATEKITLDDHEKDVIKQACEILKKKNENIDTIKIQALIDDLKTISNIN